MPEFGAEVRERSDNSSRAALTARTNILHCRSFVA
jgi:hypothetical protein